MTEKTTERDLPAGFGNGNRRAFESFFEENHKRVFSVALNFFGGDYQRAEDIAQQVFLKIFRNPESFRGESKAATWLYRITINACIDEQRKLKRLAFLPDFFGFNEAAKRGAQDEGIHKREISAEVRRAVSNLKIKFRLPILLKYAEGLSYREIAEILRCSEGTVASRLNRGHKLLARKLEHLRSEIQP